MRKSILLLVLGALLTLLLVVGYSVFEQQSYVLRTRAYISEISGKNSFTLVSPVCSQANGEEIERLYAYCLNSQGLPVEGTQVEVSLNEENQNISIQPVQGITDSTGKAIFDVTSFSDGLYSVQVKCGDYVIQDGQNICFQE